MWIKGREYVLAVSNYSVMEFCETGYADVYVLTEHLDAWWKGFPTFSPAYIIDNP